MKNLKPGSAKRLRLLRPADIPLLLGLVITWMMLWQSISLMSVLSGLLVAVLLMRLFLLPQAFLGGHFNPLAALQYVLFFLYELMLGSVQVAAVALTPGVRPAPAILAVQLKTRNDFVLTMTALTISLIPGSVLVDVDRFDSVLYLHALTAKKPKQVAQLRSSVWQIEKLLMRALGVPAHTAQEETHV